ncbi:MAG TPA: hypothetical protein VL284_08870 [Thermoanaerobaculia bacterium]|nr:hypothetical protein [Thermoanaerobaculia bacterium]
MKTLRFLAAYSLVVTAILAYLLLTAVSRSTTFDEITVHRINVVEPDGTLRMVISDHAKLPGIIVHGKERAFDRPQAGMLFYNDEGSENGGLIFGGRRDAKGQVVDSGGSLSFDKYEANQIVQLAGVNDSEDKFAGLMVSDSPKAGESHRRFWAGTDDRGNTSLALMDAAGRRRVVIEVAADGTSSMSFIDANGRARRIQ